MAKYRVHKSNLPSNHPEQDGLSFMRVSSNADGVTLDRVAFSDLEVVKLDGSGVILGRKATVITAIEPDSTNSEWFVCTTEDVVLPFNS